MSIQSAKEFIEKASIDKEFLKSCNALENGEQKNTFLKENCFDFTEEELKEVMSELSDTDLDGAAGGFNIPYMDLLKSSSNVFR